MLRRLRPARRTPTLLVLATTAAVLAGVLAPTGQVAAAGSTTATPPARVPESAAVAPRAARPESGAAGSRPNVLVIETDDMRADDLRFMPAVRRHLQRRGLTFTSSFAPNPLCCPSRASFLTGRYSHNHGVLSHVSPYGFASLDDRRTLATALQARGYRTAMVGKYLNGYGFQKLRQHHPRPGADSSRYVPPGWTRWFGTLDQGVDPLARTAGGRGGTYQYHRVGQNIDGRVRTTKGYSSDVLGAQVRGLVDTFGRSAAPWFVWWTPVAPHHGLPGERDDPRGVRDARGRTVRFVTPARPNWVKGKLDAQVTRAPGVRRDGTTETDMSDKPRWMRGAVEVNAAERRAILEVTRQRAEALHALDRQIGTTLTRLRRTPQGRRTIVVFTSDNGYYLGEHRRRQGKGSLLEPSIRVPLLIAGPGVPHGVRHDPAASIDLAPTIAAYGGANLPGTDGVDLGQVIREGDRGWDRPLVTESAMSVGTTRDPEMPRSPLTVRGLRLGGWALNRYATGEVELYDMRADPLQLENLASLPEHADERARLLGLLADYGDCAGAACSAPLPEDLRLTPAQAAALTAAQQRAATAYYG